LNSETLTNLFWGLFLIWFGFVGILVNGDFYHLLLGSRDSSLLGLGVGLLLLGLNVLRSAMRMKIGSLTLGLGAVLVIVYSPQLFLGLSMPLFPTLLVILGVALVIGALRSRNLQAF